MTLQRSQHDLFPMGKPPRATSSRVRMERSSVHRIDARTLAASGRSDDVDRWGCVAVTEALCA